MSANKSKHKKKIAAFCIALVLCGILGLCRKTDRQIRNQIVKLQSSKGSCSGVEVKAPSGVTYILSAGHCTAVSIDGKNIDVITEDGKTLSRRIIAEDPSSDLLIIEGMPGAYGLDIAKSLGRFDRVRTFTHGLGLPTYETSGYVIAEDVSVGAIISAIDDRTGEKRMLSP